MTIRHIGKNAAVLLIGCLWLLTGGCSSQSGSGAAPAPKQEAASPEAKSATKQEAAAPEAKPVPKQETAAPENKNAAASYVTAADDFGNLAPDDPALPVYDRYTLSERRAKGLPVALPAIAPYEKQKTAYLTFDDGPDEKNTDAILDILQREGVKATFYVVGRNVVAYPETVRRIFAEGHALGNHSYDHDYDRLYDSVGNYLEEMEEADEAVFRLIGMRPLITRAPGGRMSLFDEAYDAVTADNGYVEHDWNVSSADSDPSGPVAQDLIDNIAGQATMDSAIILMHSSSGHEETVRALPEIIRVLREKGYAFGVVTPMTPQPW